MPFRIKVSLIIVALLLALVFVVPLVVPIPAPQGARPLAEVAQGAELVEVSGIGLHVARYPHEGAAPAPTFVLLHDYAFWSYAFEPIAPALAAHGAVVAFDRPGFGLSERPLPEGDRYAVGLDPYTPEAQVALTHLAVIRRLAADRTSTYTTAASVYEALDRMDEAFAARMRGQLGAIMSQTNNNGNHSANGITAMFIACGQDVANVAESSALYGFSELLPNGDFEQGKEFYAKVFGFTYEDMSSEGMSYAMFSVPGGERPAGGVGVVDEGQPAYWSVTFNVADLDATLQRAAAAGSQVVMEPYAFEFGRVAVITGPDGEAFGVIEPPADAPPM